jgi:serine/threonine-protein kinase
VERIPRGYRVGDWEVTEPIGAGGWGTVYEGRYMDPDTGDADAETGAADAGGSGPERAGGAGHPRAQEHVALKFLPTAGLAPRQARRLVETARREIELGRKARHPRLIRLLDSAVLSEPGCSTLDGAVVLIMERAEHSLRQLLDPVDQAASSPGLTEAEGARLLTEICEGLAHLHGLGWVHGDLKPDNVLIMADGSARLSDFGLAVELDGTHAYMPPLGTPDYLPPERWKAPLGEQGVKVRPTVDIWALGIMVHQMFAGGASPFPGATPMTRGAAVQEYAEGRTPLRLHNAVPPFWRELAADCLAPTHAARAEHTAESLLDRIKAQKRRTGSMRPWPGAVRGRRKALLVAAVTAAVCGATAGGWWYAVGGDATKGSSGADPEAQVKVFNVEEPCRDRKNRTHVCSLGLAIDPLQPYTAENVVPTRVWHGDVLDVDCRVPEGTPVADEVGTSSPQWFRVRLPDGAPRKSAWLPAVRTKDRPVVPQCSGQSSA